MSAWKRGYDDAYLQWQAGIWCAPEITEATSPDLGGEARQYLDGFWRGVGDCRASEDDHTRVTLPMIWRLFWAEWRTAGAPFWLRIAIVLAVLAAALYGIAHIGYDADEAMVARISGFGK